MPIVKPTSLFEKQAMSQGYRLIAGIDEVGRGSWAGPIMAAAVILKPKARLPDLRDSKMLDEKRREKLYDLIVANSVAWAVGSCDVPLIDSVGIGQANRLSMEYAVTGLTVKPDFLLIDAFKLPNLGIPFQAIIKGDAKVRSIAAASIIAKVTRDRLMRQMDTQFPGYGFADHKGYGTPAHQRQIAQLGLCAIHRKSFLPISLMRQTKLI